MHRLWGSGNPWPTSGMMSTTRPPPRFITHMATRVHSAKNRPYISSPWGHRIISRLGRRGVADVGRRELTAAAGARLAGAGPPAHQVGGHAEAGVDVGEELVTAGDPLLPAAPEALDVVPLRALPDVDPQARIRRGQLDDSAALVGARDADGLAGALDGHLEVERVGFGHGSSRVSVTPRASA